MESEYFTLEQLSIERQLLSNEIQRAKLRVLLELVLSTFLVIYWTREIAFSFAFERGYSLVFTVFPLYLVAIAWFTWAAYAWSTLRGPRGRIVEEWREKDLVIRGYEGALYERRRQKRLFAYIDMTIAALFASLAVLTATFLFSP